MTPSTNTRFFDSFWKTSFYQEGKATSFWGAFWKIVVTVFAMSIITAVLFYVTFGSKIPGYMHSYANQALSGYPSDLIITIKDGMLSKNIPNELHLYPLSKEMVGTDKQGNIPFEYVFTITDSESVSLDLYQKAKSFIVIAKDGVVTQDNRGIKIVPFKDMTQQGKDFTFTKSMITPVVDTINSYADSVPFWIMLCIIVFATLLTPMWYLSLALLYGLLVMWLSKWLIGKKTIFSDSYVYVLYALAPVIVLNTLLGAIPYVKNVTVAIPFFFSITVLGFLKCMFTVKKNKISEGVDL
jgi:hypothetical protein